VHRTKIVRFSLIVIASVAILILQPVPSVKIGAATILSPIENADYLPVSGTTITFKLIDSNSNGIANGTIKCFNGSWQTLGKTNNGGELTILFPGELKTYTFSCTYLGFEQSKSVNLAEGPKIVFQTVKTTMKLIDLDKNPLAGMDARFSTPEGGYSEVFGKGTTPGTQELLPGTYLFRVTYGKSTQIKLQNVANDLNVIFQIAK
jgi:hypothetical protein